MEGACIPSSVRSPLVWLLSIRQANRGTPSWRQLGPAILSLTFTFSLLTFFTEYASPLITPWPIIDSTGSGPTRGITDILLITALTMSFILLALRRWRPPFGTFAFVFGLNGALMVVFSPNSLLVSVPTALLGGLAADLVYRFLQPSLDQPASVRLFAFLVPAMFYALYFVDLAIVGPVIFQGGIIWSVPFWAGAPVIAGIAGFLLSFVMIPPAQVAEEKDKCEQENIASSDVVYAMLCMMGASQEEKPEQEEENNDGNRHVAGQRAQLCRVCSRD